MPDELHVRRLIEEVKAHPIIWDIRYGEYKDRTTTPQQWAEIAGVLGVDVEHCKRKWKNLRDAYRAEVRRIERRIERLKEAGTYDGSADVRSKWAYFEAMSFINDSRRPKSRYPHPYHQQQQHRSSEGEYSNGSHDADADGEAEDELPAGFHSFCDIKLETHHTTDEDEYEYDDRLLEEFVNAATPQAVRRLSNSISIANAAEDAVALAAAAAEAEGAEAGVSTQPRGNSNCKCSTNRADDQVHFLEDLKREEQSLMQSTRMDIRRDNNASHVGDSNYNFLVSFLPQMKRMSELQNLQFRAKMSELMLNIMSAPQPTASGSALVIGMQVETAATATATPTASAAQLPQLQQQQQPQQPLPRLTHQELQQIELLETGEAADFTTPDFMDASNERSS